MPLHDYIQYSFSAANIVVLLGLYRKMSIIVYQHKIMWNGFAKEHHIDPTINGK